MAPVRNAIWSVILNWSWGRSHSGWSWVTAASWTFEISGISNASHFWGQECQSYVKRSITSSWGWYIHAHTALMITTPEQNHTWVLLLHNHFLLVWFWNSSRSPRGRCAAYRHNWTYVLQDNHAPWLDLRGWNWKMQKCTAINIYFTVVKILLLVWCAGIDIKK